MWQQRFATKAQMERYFLHERFPSALIAAWTWAGAQPKGALRKALHEHFVSEGRGAAADYYNLPPAAATLAKEVEHHAA